MARTPQTISPNAAPQNTTKVHPTAPHASDEPFFIFPSAHRAPESGHGHTDKPEKSQTGSCFANDTPDAARHHSPSPSSKPHKIIHLRGLRKR